MGTLADGHGRSERRDLSDRAEITEMVRRFYRDVAQDDLLGPVFGDVARVDWSAHLPKLVDFWCRILLSEPGYIGNPLREHERIHRVHPFTEELFERWLHLFRSTVADWEGPRAEAAVAFAERVATAHLRHLRRTSEESRGVGDLSALR